MEQDKTVCEFSAIEKLYFEMDEEKIMEHVLECGNCLNQFIEIERKLLFQKNQLDSKYSTIEDENNHALMVDNLRSTNDIQKIKSLKSMYQVMDGLSIMEAYENKENYRTPRYLKNLIQEEIRNESDGLKEKIVIKISEGLNVLGNFMENLFLVSNEFDPVAVRSNVIDTEKIKSSTLNFYQIGINNEKITYYVVKDGLESILLTIKLDNFGSLPVSINILSKNQLISSQPIKENLVYFPKLNVGNYNMEIKYQPGIESRLIPISLV